MGRLPVLVTIVRELETANYFWGAFPDVFWDGVGDITNGDKFVAVESLPEWCEYLWWNGQRAAALHPTLKFQLLALVRKKQALTQASVCVNTRIVDKDITAAGLQRLIDDDDDRRVGRALISASANVSGTSASHVETARKATAVTRALNNGRFSPMRGVGASSERPAGLSPPGCVAAATTTAAAAPAAAAPAPTTGTDSGGGSSPARRKRGGKSAPTGTPAASTKAAASPPARAAKQLPSNTGMPPVAEAMDGSDGGVELFFEQCVEDDEVDDQTSAHGTATVMKSLYENLFGNAKPTKAQMTGGGARERTPSEVESDAQRLEEHLLASTPSTQDF